MTPRSPFLAGLIFAVLTPGPAAGGQSAVATADSLVRAFMTAHRIPAVSVAVADSTGIVYRGTYGFADVENRVPATPETLFRIASVTKPLTAAGVLRLVDTGRLDLDAPIQTYCPAFPAKRWPVTARMLMAHTGGLRDYTRVERGVWLVETAGGRQRGSSTVHLTSVDEAVAVFAADPLVSEPGTVHRYSNWGYVLLGCAIEGASGRSYESYMADELFDVLGMTRTRSNDAYTIIENRARAYQMRTEATKDFWWFIPEQKRAMAVGELYNARFEDTSHKLPAGGMLSTAVELARFGAGVVHGDFLAPATRAEMMTEQRTRAGDPTGWTLGWSVGNGVVGLRGAQPGVTAQLTTVPSAGLTVAIVANRDLVPTGDLFRELAAAWGVDLP
ncbi:MAG: serine hydrolase domain-containing protein [Gemmatimonadota bacterium]